MKGQTEVRKPDTGLLLAMLLLLTVAAGAYAQVPVDENGKPIAAFEEQDIVGAAAPGVGEFLTAAELEELVGPIALYPDDLLAIVLPASTYPLEIVQAARFLEQLESDGSLQPDEAWDESIVALLNYPEVVRMMNEDIDWTWRLGEAVLAQQTEIIAAVESFRDRAYAAGNLKSDEHQVVRHDEGIIEIVPVEEHLIHVPYYEPAEVVVYQPRRRVHFYYPEPYPVYYYPYPLGYSFRSGYFWGVTTAFSIGWTNQYLNVYHLSYWGHPYYGRTYYDNYYYRRPSITVYNNWYVNNNYRDAGHRHRDGDYWQPRDRAGARQDEPRVRNYHYAPNGSSNSRDFEVSRRERLRVSDDGRMDLALRSRDDNRSGAQAQRQLRDSGRVRTGADAGTATRRELANRGTRTMDTSGDSTRTRTATNSAERSEGAARPAVRFRDRSSNTDRSAAQRDTGIANRREPARPTVGQRERAPVATGNAGRSRTVEERSNTLTNERRSVGRTPDTAASGLARRIAPAASTRQAPVRTGASPAPPRPSATVQRSARTTVRPSAPTVTRPAPANSSPAPAARAPAVMQGPSSRQDSGAGRAGSRAPRVRRGASEN